MRLRKRNGIYQAIYYDADGRRRWRSTKCSDKRAAEAAARRFEREAQDPNSTAEDAATLTDALEDLLDHMEELVGAGRRSRGTFSMHRDKAGHLRRVFELQPDGELVPYPLRRLDATTVDAYISERRADGAKENTIAKELVTLRCALKLAKRRGKWSGDIDAVLPTRFAPEYKPRERWLTPAEVQAVIAQLPPDHAARVAFAVATSANRSETFHAQREDIGDGAVLIRGTKRTSRRRVVPIVAPWQVTLLVVTRQHAQGEDGKLFRYDGGFHDALLQACEDAKVPPATSNDLRRTFAHWMRQSGVPRELVAAAMGHGSTAMVDKVYGKLTADELTALMVRALGGTHMAQTNADRADSLDASDERRKGKRGKTARKRKGSGAGEGNRTPTGLLQTDFESSPLEDLKPRDYRINRDYAGAGGTHVAQRPTADGAVVIPLPTVRRR